MFRNDTWLNSFCIMSHSHHNDKGILIDLLEPHPSVIVECVEELMQKNLSCLGIMCHLPIAWFDPKTREAIKICLQNILCVCVLFTKSALCPVDPLNNQCVYNPMPILCYMAHVATWHMSRQLHLNNFFVFNLIHNCFNCWKMKAVLYIL